MTAPSPQAVGESLTIECSVSLGRDISSRVEILWSSNGVDLQRIANASLIAVDSFSVYKSSYTLSQLNTADNGGEYQCTVLINTSPPLMATGSVTLNITSKYIRTCLYSNTV